MYPTLVNGILKSQQESVQMVHYLLCNNIYSMSFFLILFSTFNLLVKLKFIVTVLFFY